MYICVYIHVSVHIYIHVFIYMCLYTYIHTYMKMYISATQLGFDGEVRQRTRGPQGLLGFTVPGHKMGLTSAGFDSVHNILWPEDEISRFWCILNVLYTMIKNSESLRNHNW